MIMSHFKPHCYTLTDVYFIDRRRTQLSETEKGKEGEERYQRQIIQMGTKAISGGGQARVPS